MCISEELHKPTLCLNSIFISPFVIELCFIFIFIFLIVYYVAITCRKVDKFETVLVISLCFKRQQIITFVVYKKIEQIEMLIFFKMYLFRLSNSIQILSSLNQRTVKQIRLCAFDWGKGISWGHLRQKGCLSIWNKGSSCSHLFSEDLANR